MVSDSGEFAYKEAERERLGLIRGALATLGASFIYFLIRMLGRTVLESEVPWG